jgi:PAS domain-containing protein
MGLLLRAAASAVPETSEAFVVVDDALAVRAVSRRAEKLLGISETAAIDRHVGDLLEEVGDEEAGTPRLSEALAGATRGSRIGELPVSPRNAFGVRWWARVAPCLPGPAAVVVLVERL